MPPTDVNQALKLLCKWGSNGGLGFFWGCQGGCERERRIEVIVKIKKKKCVGRGSGQGGSERRIKVFVKMQIKKKSGGGGGGRAVVSQGGCE